MKANDKINDLKRQISELEANIHNCKHVWGDTEYAPINISEPYGFNAVGRGSDVWYEPVGYTNVIKDRWSRTCEICGKIEYTNKEETIKMIKQPKF